ncbi:HU family DNA-binding protein [Prevotella sp. KH2C16]|uniref:HU family DNA-binding protein n=1 Tax=Prevotella sp. KH2C16 TaxID=1855325 RepID=UPI0008EE5A3F|nr:HU family DNA-binding protein [Prevotella sp. KH2C16]SFG63693.1 DNA-binding protein, histone-like, putative [Prevotella sp. KH2C16]
MAILYRLYQDNRSNSLYPGKWYAKAVHQNIVGLDTVAERIQRNCSMKKSDVLAVLTEMVEVMKDELQSSNIVKLDGFGQFKVGITTKPAATAADFNAAKNVAGYRVNFLPASHSLPNGVNEKGHTRHIVVRNMLDGITCREAPKNTVDTSKPAAPAEGDNKQPGA